MANPDPNTENLIPFKKGDKRINRKGRPKLPDISEALEKVLNEEKDGLKALDAVLKALRNKAIKGDVRAIQELLDRAYGKSKQIMDIESGGEPISAVNIRIINQPPKDGNSG